MAFEFGVPTGTNQNLSLPNFSAGRVMISKTNDGKHELCVIFLMHILETNILCKTMHGKMNSACSGSRGFLGGLSNQILTKGATLRFLIDTEVVTHSSKNRKTIT